METNSLVQLTEEEKNVLVQYKQKSDSEAFSLGNLRKQFLASEKQVLERCAKADQDLMDHLRILAKANGVPEDEQWSFSFDTFSFSKVEAQ
jgi:hypothetical protein